jgi:predicted deacylase
VTIQGSLHADEVPGMLVAHHLRNHLDALEAAGRLTGEVVLVPMANPLGVGQWVLRGFQGRFELHSGENFNRHFANLTDAVLDRVMDRLGADAAENVRLVRGALREAVAALGATSAGKPAQDPAGPGHRRRCGAGPALRRRGPAAPLHHAADLAGRRPAAGPLHRRRAGPAGRALRRRALRRGLLHGLAPAGRAPGPGQPLPPACMAATIELRGEADVRHDLAAGDAQGIVTS